jgi:hypothetical protein
VLRRGKGGKCELGWVLNRLVRERRSLRDLFNISFVKIILELKWNNLGFVPGGLRSATIL